MLINDRFEAIRAALEAARQSRHADDCPARPQKHPPKTGTACTCHRGQARLALSLIESHGEPTLEELREELGNNWVIARRTPRIVAQYGSDVVCCTHKTYEAAQLRALNKRAVRMGVAPLSVN